MIPTLGLNPSVSITILIPINIRFSFIVPQIRDLANSHRFSAIARTSRPVYACALFSAGSAGNRH
jgi:hypothetical protein